MLRALYEIARSDNDNPVPVSFISKEQQIPRKYLEQLFRHLKQVGVIKSFFGAKGGYKLVKEPNELTLKEIINASEGSIKIHDCEARKKKKSCYDYDNCVFRDFWTDFNEHIEKFLESYTLADFVEEKEEE